MTPHTYVQVSCLRGSLTGRTFAFIDPAPVPLPQPLLLGRGADCHIRFQSAAEEMISRHHGELQMGVDGVRFVDGSTHGSYLVQHQRRISALEINRGSQAVIQLGPGGPICQIAVGLAVPFGNYSLVAKLGEGGMAEVYVAGDTRLDRFVVLKLLRPDLRLTDPLAEQHLLEEARVVAQLENNHVIRIYELGDWGGVPYIAMEYLRGISLQQLTAQLVKLGTRMPPDLAAAIVRQACLGLHAAHELPSKVVHRDISPNNILITHDTVKVIDFGIARANKPSGTPVTEPHVTKGCPPYMSPEQISAPSTVTRLSDIFSMAVVLYELCSGSSLFLRDHAVATMMAVITHEPPPLRSVCSQASERLEQLLTRAMAKKPAERWPTTAAEFASLLKEEAGPEFLHHDNIVSALEQLGVKLQSAPPVPLAEEPELIRRARPVSPMRLELPPPLPEGVDVQPAPVAKLTAQPKPTATENDPLERAFEQVDDGWIGIDAPVEMSAGSVYIVRATAIRGLLHHQIAKDQSDDEVDTMPLGRLLRLELLPDNPALFTVQPLSPAEQPVLRSKLTQWDWQVVAQKASSEQTLRVRATNNVDVHGQRVSKYHPVRVLTVQVKPPAGAKGIVGLPTTTLRGLLERLLATDADFERFCLDYFPKIHQRFDHTWERAEKVNLLLYLAVGERLVESLRKRDPQLVAQAEAQALASLDPDWNTRAEASGTTELLRSVALPEHGGHFELSSPLISQLSVASYELHQRNHREPIPLPLGLDGMVSDCPRPLVLALANRLAELRVAPETLKAGRSFRIYPAELTTSGARNSYTLPLPCPGKQLFIGHHRGAHRVITVTSSAAEPTETAPPPLDLGKLGVRIVAPSGTERLFAVYSIEPERSRGYVACITIRRG